MNIKKFEDIIAWQKAQKLAECVYECFGACKDYSFKDQIRRASVSVMNNIAEGFERQTNKELIQFFYIARGSCGEVRSMLYLAKKFKYIGEREFEYLNGLSVEVSKLIYGFIKSIRNKD